MKNRWLDLMTGRRRIALLAAGLLILAVPLVAAAVSVRLTSGIVTVTCADGAPCDQNPLPGIVTFSGAVGPVFFTNTTIAITGPPGSASLDLISTHTSVGPGTLKVEASHTGYTGPLVGGLYPYLLSAATTLPTGGTAAFGGFLDPTNTLFGILPPAFTIGGFFFGPGPGGFGDTIFGFAPVGPLGPPFSLTLVVDITHTGAGTTGLSFKVLPFGVPPPVVAEPGMLSLLGIGLGSVLIGGRRRRHLPA